jgi:aspartate/methionine/tyrosine aminotransferase
MSDLTQMTPNLLAPRLLQFQNRYRRLCALRPQLNMARGIPAAEQVALSNAMLSLPGEEDYLAEGGVDCRNYTGLQGLVEARRLFSGVVGVPAEQMIAGGNSSLAFMYDCIGYAWRHGMSDSERPWGKEDQVSFLCPVPGYDRHFRICEEYGIRLVPVPLFDHGPDMDIVRDLIARDPSVKGMWCVPRYSNPTGVVYAKEIIEALAAMPAAAPDFRLFWDDAYAVHHLTEEQVQIANVVELCSRHGHPNRALVFASTSKVTFAGAGIALFGSSPGNVSWLLERMSIHTVGPDKLNQLRHVRFLKDGQGIRRLMDGHRAILAPKFAQVQAIFERELGGRGIAQWSKPKGGYFISLEVLAGCATRVFQLAKEAGITLTTPGATFPGGRDPNDSILRIAPSSLAVDQVGTAAEAIALCVLLATTEALIGRAAAQ